MKWFIKVLRHYADFSGRARRKEYWMFALFNAVFWFAWIFLAIFVSKMTGTADWNVALVLNIASILYMTVMLLPGMAVARRLHDQDKSGWWLLVGLIPLVGGIWLFILMVTEGQSGDNRYGPNPKTSAETFG